VGGGLGEEVEEGFELGWRVGVGGCVEGGELVLVCDGVHEEYEDAEGVGGGEMG